MRSLVGMLLVVIGCTAPAPREQPPATQQVRVVRVSMHKSVRAMVCNSYFSSVTLANDSGRTIHVAAVDLLTSQYHRVPIDLTLAPRSEATFEFGTELDEPHRELLKLSGCKKPPQHGQWSEDVSVVSEAEYVD